MKKSMTIAAIFLLAACAQQGQPRQSSVSQSAEPPTQFQSIGTCEPTAWAGLQKEAERLPPDQHARVEMMFDEAQSYYAEANRGQCILVLQNVERIVRQSKATS
jgi:hypothetical protein